MWDVTFARTDDPRGAVQTARKTRPGRVVIGEHRADRHVAFILDLQPSGLELSSGAAMELLRAWRSITRENAAYGTGDPAGRRDCVLLLVPEKRAKQMRRIFRALLEREGSYELGAELAAKAESAPVA
jgi:hypothetical protein